MKSVRSATRGPRNLLLASLVLLALALFYAFLNAYGLAANVALAFTLLGGCILCLVLFTIRIGRGHPGHDHEHEHDH